MLDQLRAATRSHHAALEDALPLMRADLTEDLYTTVLLRFFRVYAPLEAQVSRHKQALQNLGVDVQARRKTHLLRRDLLALGNAPEDVESIPHADVPAVDSVASALGAMYVLEGSTLGGQLISRHLRTTLGLTPERGGAFFWAYGPDVGVMWRRFLTALELPDAPRDADAVQAACDTAVATFSAFLAFAIPKEVHT